MKSDPMKIRFPGFSVSGNAARAVRYTVTAGLALLALFLTAPKNASAITAFSRQYAMPCDTCHEQHHRLNDTGREFKEHGYYIADLAGGKVFSPNKFLELSEYPPIQIRLQSFLLSHQKSASKPDRTKFIIPDDAAIQAASAFGPSFSLFAEVSVSKDGGASVGTANMDWHAPKGKVSVRAGNFQPDEWLQASVGSGMRALTRQPYAFEEHTAPNASMAQTLDMETPGFMLYGRPTKPLWLDAAVVEGDTTNGQKDFWGHASYRFANKYVAHVFGYSGKVGDPAEDFTRMGAALVVPVVKATVVAVWSAESYSKAGDAGADAKYNTGFVGFTYPFTPRAYADARWEFINSTHVTPKENKNLTTVQLGYLPRLNVRTAVEFTADSKNSKNDIFTWLLDVST